MRYKDLKEEILLSCIETQVGYIKELKEEIEELEGKLEYTENKLNEFFYDDKPF